MTRTLRLVAPALLLLVALLAAPAAGAAATPPPTLTGETLRSTSGNNSQNTLSCNAESGDRGGTFTFGATGTAPGPYSGPFTETGRGTIVQGDSGQRTLTDFTASFTIDSPLGQVTGTKTLIRGTGFCDEATRLVGVFVETTYRATITTPEGITYTDTGTTTGVGMRIGGSDLQTTFMEEIFASSQTTTIPVAPTSQEQCKDGGYARFTDPSTGAPFTNQGRCIQFVNTGK